MVDGGWAERSIHHSIWGYPTEAYLTAQLDANKRVQTSTRVLVGFFPQRTLQSEESHIERHAVALCHRPDHEKTEPTFTDAIATVRRLFWTRTVSQQPHLRKALEESALRLRTAVLDYLARTM